MKSKSPIIAVTCGLLSLNVAAATFAKAETKVESSKEISVNLYAKPESSAQIVEAIKPNQHLVPIYQQGEWIKVGNPRNGDVGWINKKQYRQAYNAWYQPQVKTIFVRNEENKDGKPVVNIVAYSNGKKLDEKDAKALYERMQKQQKKEMQAMQHFNQRMNSFFAHENMMFERDFPGFVHFDFAPPMMMRPIIVVTQPAQANKPAKNAKPLVQREKSK